MRFVFYVFFFINFCIFFILFLTCNLSLCICSFARRFSRGTERHTRRPKRDGAAGVWAAQRHTRANHYLDEGKKNHILCNICCNWELFIYLYVGLLVTL